MYWATPYGAGSTRFAHQALTVLALTGNDPCRSCLPGAKDQNRFPPAQARGRGLFPLPAAVRPGRFGPWAAEPGGARASRVATRPLRPLSRQPIQGPRPKATATGRGNRSGVGLKSVRKTGLNPRSQNRTTEGPKVRSTANCLLLQFQVNRGGGAYIKASFLVLDLFNPRRNCHFHHLAL
ncbi:hypothetical protein D3C78_980770 [compost metagenome]